MYNSWVLTLLIPCCIIKEEISGYGNLLQFLYVAVHYIHMNLHKIDEIIYDTDIGFLGICKNFISDYFKKSFSMGLCHADVV